MMGRVLCTSDAEESRVDIWLHIAKESPQAADRLIDRIDAKCQLYATQPQMGEPRPDLGENIRCFSVGDYVVIYRPLDDGIIVLLAIHGAMDIPTAFRKLFRV